MTTAYLHLTDNDKPESQTAITASFVDKDGKHIDIGGGGTSEIHTDDTLAGTGTTGNPLKLSDNTNSNIAKAVTLTGDNLVNKDNIVISDSGCSAVRVIKTGTGYLSILVKDNNGIEIDNSFGAPTVISVPAIPALAAISTLAASASLSEVVAKVNEILNAVKNSNVLTKNSNVLTDLG